MFFAVTVMLQRKQYPSVSEQSAADPAIAAVPLGKQAIGTLAIIAIFVVVIGGIYAGIFTSTEASGIGVVTVLAVAAITRRLTVAALRAALTETLRTTAAIPAQWKKWL